MPHFLFDTSALVKNYVPEPGTTWVRAILADPTTIPLISEIAIVEVSAATSILARVGRLRRIQARRAYAEFIEYGIVGKYRFVPLSRPLIATAAELAQKHPLKAYDAAHLATAIHLQHELAHGGFSVTFV